VLLAVSPFFGRSTVALVEQEPPAPTLFATAAPYLTLLPGMAWNCYLISTGRTFTRGEMLVVGGIAAALILRQLLSNAEHHRIVARISAREAEARAAALRDPLTELANRTALHESLTAHLPLTPMTLALLDVDDFKAINDTHGHDTGDAVLCALAGRLRRALPSGALVARLGGDEFAVCVPGAAADQLSETLLAVFDDPVALGPRLFHITASIGMVLIEPGTTTTAAALSHVDVAMYEAKGRRAPKRSGVVVLDEHARARAAARVQLRDDVSRPRLAEFRVVYEPVVDLATGQVVGAEALLRWQHPVLGAVPPATFIPLAEQVGSIHDLGGLALRTAVSDLAGWLMAASEAGAPLDEAVIGVNLSPRQLGAPGLVALVSDLLAEHGVAPRRLVLEITEEALLEDWGTAVEAVHALRSLGVGVAVDDFGTGYSSMRYLRRFETSTLKIDREFVEMVADEPRTRALVASVVDLARQLGLVTVAEGIETLDQLHVMRALGCQLAQGYLFDRPLEREAFGELLLARHTYPLGVTPELPQPRGEVRPLHSLG
jgi:diguanylate cyclase (GGDEF)-like protein